jgi:maleylpyruvate isomerase
LIDLYTFYRSSCSYRVRIALGLKGISYRSHAVNLTAGQQKDSQYLTQNPQGFVPYLVDDAWSEQKDGTQAPFGIGQSMAILEYLEDMYPTPSLRPSDLRERATMREIMHIIGCDIQPLQNLRILKYLESKLKSSEKQKLEWIQYVIREGLQAVEAIAQKTAGSYCLGGQVTLADACLMPQLYNAERFELNLNQFPTLKRIKSRLEQLPAVQAAHPSCQADAPKQ